MRTLAETMKDVEARANMLRLATTTTSSPIGRTAAAQQRSDGERVTSTRLLFRLLLGLLKLFHLGLSPELREIAVHKPHLHLSRQARRKLAFTRLSPARLRPFGHG
jgi:hypothetical protein